MTDPFLPLDAEFWNDDRTRYTVFFDPGRQKRGIAPIADMGRSLTEGKSYTLVVDAEWRDGNGLPLKQPFRRTFKVGPPDERPLDPKTWTDSRRPRPARSTPLTVAFPEPLDHGLLLRALGVLAPDGKPLARRGRRRHGRADVGVHARGAVEGRRRTTSSRSRCWRTWPATASAARSKSISSIARTRAASPRRR